VAVLRRKIVLAGALARALLIYWLVVFPRARREVRKWTETAGAIEDPVLRELALGKLRSESLVAEGAAAFAILSARAHRANVVRAVVAYEILYDVVDAIGEAPAADPLSHNRAVHAALLDALAPAEPLRHRVSSVPASPGDGCYLTLLVGRCRDVLCRLPAHGLVLPALERFAARAAEAQSLNHAGSLDGHRALAHWAAAQPVSDLLWWEVAAAAGDPLGVFALLAAAGDPRTLPGDVTAIEHAYFPWIGALVWLMESLVDQRDDAGSGNHSYVGHYASTQHGALRLSTIAGYAAIAAARLPRGPSHAVLLAGVAGLYLSDPSAMTSEASEGAQAIREMLGWPVDVLLVVLRVRRRLTHRRRPIADRRPGGSHAARRRWRARRSTRSARSRR
jgi:tetraprenyl-beta-curcumene synthase